MMISLFTLHTVHAERLEVFTLKTEPVSLNGLRVKVCELDGLELLTEALNKTNSSFRAYPSMDSALQKSLTDFYRCKLQASRYALKFLPAIVIDEAFVVYGVHQVDKALIATRQYREGAHA